MKHISLSSSTELAEIAISVDIEFDEIAISVMPFSRPRSSCSPSPFLVVLRLQKVDADVNTIHELSVVMSIDFSKAVNEVHPSLRDHSSAYSKNSQVLHLTYHLALILTV
ncbi:unnamed protein product [Prunus armeniaca]